LYLQLFYLIKFEPVAPLGPLAPVKPFFEGLITAGPLGVDPVIPFGPEAPVTPFGPEAPVIPVLIILIID